MTRRTCTTLSALPRADEVAMHNRVKAERRRRNKAARKARRANR